MTTVVDLLNPNRHVIRKVCHCFDEFAFCHKVSGDFTVTTKTIQQLVADYTSRVTETGQKVINLRGFAADGMAAVDRIRALRNVHASAPTRRLGPQTVSAHVVEASRQW